LSTARPNKVPALPPAPAVQVARELELVEERIAGLLRSRESRLTDISTYLINSGGKRVRPAVTILMFRACGGEDLRDIVDVAVALELIHSASLLHDDIIDGSSIRRGRDSALQKYGIAETLVTGDFLFSRAFQICGRFEEKLIHWAAEACIRLTEGEIMQGRFRHNPSVTLDDYIEIITCKTASLFEAGARTAAHLAGASDETVDRIAECGLHVGLTFQMIDDLLDITAAQKDLGKPIGLDLRDGNPSLPVVLALEANEQVASLFRNQTLSEDDFSVLLRLLRQPALVKKGYDLATQHALRARERLAHLPSSEYRETLLALVDQLVDRGC
jgi:octaprenyl-diphosphate synthase